MSYYKQKKINISEEQKNEILYKYNILNEASRLINNYTLRVGSRGFFANGKWKNLQAEAQAEFDRDKEATKNFVKEWGDIPGYIIEVQIEASESQVTNYDREVQGNVRLPKGELSKRRAETMKRILTQLFESYMKEGIINKMPIFQEPIIKIGKTSYIRGKSNPKAPIYDKERYVIYSLKAIREKTPIIKEPKEPNLPSDCNLSIQFVHLPKASGNLSDVNIVYKKPLSPEKRVGEPQWEGIGFMKGCCTKSGIKDASFSVSLNDTLISKFALDGGEGVKFSQKIQIPANFSKILEGGNSLKLSINCLKQKCSYNFGFRLFKNNVMVYESCLPIVSRYLTSDFDYSGVFPDLRTTNQSITIGNIINCDGKFVEEKTYLDFRASDNYNEFESAYFKNVTGRMEYPEGFK